MGWGALAPIAGVILLKFGIHTVFMVFVVIYSLAFIPTLLMPARLLNGAGQKLIAELPSPSDSSTSDQQLDALEVPVQPPGSEKEKVNATTAAGGVAVDAGKRLNDAVVIVGLQEKAVEGVVAVSTAVRTPPGGLSRRTTAVHSAPPVPGEQAQGREALPQSTQSTDPCMDLPASVEKRKSQGQAQEQAPTVSLVADGRAMHHSTVPEIIVLAGTPDDVKGLTGAQVTVKGEDTDLKGKAIASEGCDGNGGAPGAHLDLVHAVSMDAQSRSVWQGLKPLLKDVCVLAFFFKALLMGAGNGFIGYLFLVLTDLGGDFL